MVILRIWHPSLFSKNRVGASAVTIMGLWGKAHISTRPLPVDPDNPGRAGLSAIEAPATTLEDDMKAEGKNPPHFWHFTRMDECRMLRMWGTLEQDVGMARDLDYDPASSFRVSDIVLAAGRGIAVETNPVASFSARARGMVVAADVASSFVQLQGRADYLTQVEHW